VVIVLAELLRRLNLRNEKYFRRVAVGAVPVLLYCGIAAFYELGFYRMGRRFLPKQ
jgi:hypothetical protein